uniref:Dehydrogenase/reductase (SDR family) member 1 n=1 Tax=Sinocyclocheilus grahami TaxID=75366 RepID=A0A672L178_SINGR
MALSGWICVVTGASRGIGRGIALQLSEAGATVYITGRQEKTLKQTAAEVWKLRGGRCLPLVCDSSKEDEIKELFERVQHGQNGRLDLLVNNAYAGVQGIMDNLNKKFWEVDPDVWDTKNQHWTQVQYKSGGDSK